jgi:serine/threonine-protein phosphatase PP1 catalytic subunit
MDSTRLDAMIHQLTQERTFVLTDDDVEWLCEQILQLFLSEPSVLDLTGPIHVCGDIHGQFWDLIRVFTASDIGPDSRYLFLGDYVDRGPQSLEVVCLLFAMKLRAPTNIFLLRGNHESREMTECFGFAAECADKLAGRSYELFLSVFECMPIVAIVNQRIFCVHGGLSPATYSIQSIREIERPTEIPADGLLADLLWSDPSADTHEWGPNSRRETWTWGLCAAHEFMRVNGIDLVIRAHQMAAGGFDYPFDPDHSVLTIFTASSYANKNTNSAAFVTIGEDSALDFTVLPPLEVLEELDASPATPVMTARVEIESC